MMSNTQPRKQCAKCPWKVSTDPREIPRGYCEIKHRKLNSTISKPADLGSLFEFEMMACHETRRGRELPCVGWLHHQIGEGNNIGLRLAVIRGRIDGNVEIVGEQHRRLEDTFPAPRKRRKA